jgi:H+/Cl- antiporter ClcA
MKRALELSFFIFIPAVIIGAVGGLLGAIFIFTHLKASKLRRKLFSRIDNQHLLRLAQVLEVVLIAVCNSSFHSAPNHLLGFVLRF